MMNNALSSRCDARLEIKFLDEAGLFEGYASVFDVIDSVGDKIAPGGLRGHPALIE